MRRKANQAQQAKGGIFYKANNGSQPSLGNAGPGYQMPPASGIPFLQSLIQNQQRAGQQSGAIRRQRPLSIPPPAASAQGVVQRQVDPAAPSGAVTPLEQAYQAALRESRVTGNYEDAARKLNAFNREDIQDRLASLGPEEVARMHWDAQNAEGVGPQSQIALLTSPDAPAASMMPAPSPAAPAIPASSSRLPGPAAHGKPGSPRTGNGYPLDPAAWNPGLGDGVQLLPMVESELPSGFSAVPRDHLWVGNYRIVPVLRNHDDPHLLYYTAYNTASERVEFAISPADLEMFKQHDFLFMTAAGNFFGLSGQREDYEVSSARVAPLMMHGDVRGAVHALGKSWHEALHNKIWWMTAVLATLGAYTGGTAAAGREIESSAVPPRLPEVPETPPVLQPEVSAPPVTEPMVPAEPSAALEPAESAPPATEPPAPAEPPTPKLGELKRAKQLQHSHILDPENEQAATPKALERESLKEPGKQVDPNPRAHKLIKVQQGKTPGASLLNKKYANPGMEKIIRQQVQAEIDAGRFTLDRNGAMSVTLDMNEPTGWLVDQDLNALPVEKLKVPIDTSGGWHFYPTQ